MTIIGKRSIEAIINYDNSIIILKKLVIKLQGEPKNRTFAFFGENFSKFFSKIA